MRRLSVLLVLLALSPLAGCLEQIESGLGRVGSDPPPPKAYASSFEDFVAPQHEKRYPFPVEAGATEARVAVTLLFESEEAPAAPPAVPAQVEVSFRDPEGAPVGERKTVNPQAPSTVVYVRDFTSFGEYTLVVAGNGLSGSPGGAKYNATLEVVY